VGEAPVLARPMQPWPQHARRRQRAHSSGIPDHPAPCIDHLGPQPVPRRPLHLSITGRKCTRSVTKSPAMVHR
jgi:hypothetical protein